jgi:hypothetical protein
VGCAVTQVIPDGSNHGETAVLVFQAGPPYEDIAFKIVNKDWEFSHKRGFKCSFERGIMHLYIKYDPHVVKRLVHSCLRPICALVPSMPRSILGSKSLQTIARWFVDRLSRPDDLHRTAVRAAGRSFKRFRYRR